MRRLLLALALACVALGAPAEEVPLRGHGRVLLVEATVNGRLTGRFLVDTGATFCVLGKDKAREAMVKGRRGGQKVRLTTAAGVVEATLGEARRIEVGSAVARDVEVAVVEEDPAPGLDGVLGLSFLGQFKYSVDSEKGVLRLEK